MRGGRWILVVLVTASCFGASPVPSASPSPVAEPSGSPSTTSTPTRAPMATNTDPLPDCPATSTFVPQPPRAFTPTHGDVTFDVVGQLGGPVTSLALVSDRLYVGVGTRLEVVDIADPTHMRLIGSSPPLRGRVRAIAAQGTLAVASLGTSGLAVLNITDPEHPLVTTVVPLPGSGEAVALDGTFAYVADGPSGVAVIDLADPRTPKVSATALAKRLALGITLGKGSAYVATGGGGVVPLDLTDPLHPAERSALAVPGYALGSALIDTTLVVAAAWAGVALIDVSAPSANAPSMIALTSWAMAATSGPQARAYVAAADAGMRIVDLTTKTDVGGYGTQIGHVGAIVVGGANAFLADELGGVHAIALAGASPKEVGAYRPPALAQGIALVGSTAYVGGGRSGLRAIDVTDPAHPVGISSFDVADRITGVEATDNAVLAFNPFGTAFALDRADPADLHGVAWLMAARNSAALPGVPGVGAQSFAGPFRSGVVAGKTAFWAIEWGLLIVDASKAPALCSLALLRTTDNPSGRQGTAVGVDVSGTVAYLGVQPAPPGTGGLFALDLSDVRTPKVIGSIPPDEIGDQGVQDVLAGGALVFATTDSSFAVVDASDPTALRVLGQTDLLAGPPAPTETALQSMAVAGGSVLLADGAAGLLAFDVSSPRAPRLAGRLAIPGVTTSVVVRGDLVYVGSTAGLFIARWRSAAAAFLPGAGAHLMNVPTASPTCVVTTDAGEGLGSLAACISSIDAGGIITFDPAIFPSASARRIQPTTDLPAITRSRVTIDARGTGVILDGAGNPKSFAGIAIKADGVVLKGLTVEHYGTGVFVVGTGNVIGGADRADGNTIANNRGQDLVVHMSSGTRVENNTIGSTPKDPSEPIATSLTVESGSGHTLIARNAIAGSVFITDPGSSYNEVVGNTIGVEQARLQHGPHQLRSFLSISQPYSRVGGTAPGETNTIAATLDVRTHDVIVLGNQFGVPGQAFERVDLRAAEHSTIGGLDPREGNIIVAGPDGTGIWFDDYSRSNLVLGNDIRAGRGMLLDGAEQNLVAQNRVAAGDIAIELHRNASLNRFYGNTLRAAFAVNDAGQGNLFR